MNARGGDLAPENENRARSARYPLNPYAPAPTLSSEANGTAVGLSNEPEPPCQ
jgi:hypothetical protein